MYKKMFLGIYGENRLQNATVNIVCMFIRLIVLFHFTEDHMLDKKFYLICSPLKIKIKILLL